MRRSIALASVFVTLTVAVNAQTRVITDPGACGSQCLRGFITQYLDALISHNPKAVPTAPTARFTEDTKTLTLGEGLWKGASKLCSYRQDFLDIREGVAASHVVVEENATPVMLALRLKIENKKITEIETMVTRSKAEGAIFDIEVSDGFARHLDDRVRHHLGPDHIIGFFVSALKISRLILNSSPGSIAC